jgi:hypothetical protein
MTTSLEDVTTAAKAYGAEQFAAGAASRQDEVDVVRQSLSLTEEQLQAALARIGELTKPDPVTSSFVLGMAYESNTDPTPVEKRIGFVLGSRRTYYGSSEAEIKKAETNIRANIAAGRKVSSVSFKVPFTWAEVASGKGDAWAIALRDRLAKLVAGSGHIVKIAFNHEPENDKAPNNGGTVAGRDNWKAMQLRLAPLFDQPGLFFIVIVMGMHSVRTSDSLYKIWRLDLAIPDQPGHQGRRVRPLPIPGPPQGRRDDQPDGWSPQEADYKAIQSFHATRPGLAWGLSETAHTEDAEQERPGLLATTQALVAKYGGSWLEWFNSNLNSTAKWEMAAASAREKSFAAVAGSLR